MHWGRPGLQRRGRESAGDAAATARKWTWITRGLFLLIAAIGLVPFDSMPVAQTERALARFRSGLASPAILIAVAVPD